MKRFFLLLVMILSFSCAARQSVVVRSVPSSAGIPANQSSAAVPVSPRYYQYYNQWFPVSLINGLGYDLVIEVGATQESSGEERVSFGQTILVHYQRGYEDRQVMISGRVLEQDRLVGTLPVIIFPIPAADDGRISNLVINIDRYNPLRY